MLVGKGLKRWFDSKDIFNHWHCYTQQMTKWDINVLDFGGKGDTQEKQDRERNEIK